jgi:hypothetical protein
LIGAEKMMQRKFKPTKSELLKKYDRFEPQYFIQYLGFADLASSGVPESFKPAGEDKDGHVLLMGDTWELPAIHGIGLTKGSGPAVRVLIKEGTTKAEALALLAKMTAWIEKDGIPN